MLTLELHLLSNGHFTLDKSLLVYAKYQGEAYEAALKPLLIITDEKRVLIDTGIGELPEKYMKFHIVKRTPEETLKTQLQRYNLEPEDIDVIINTHLHFDHCGNNKDFANALFYVQADELRYAHNPDRFQKSGYLQESFDVEVKYIPIQGSHRVTENINILPTPGHSIGHQSVVIRKGGKNIVYCGDAAPIRENIERRNIPGVLYRSDLALRSIDRLRKIENAEYIFAHEREDNLPKCL
ncbi:MAG: N-acyl homoserine lactonase family protein [Candidatus Bathyarchaeota archaeon]|nr:MAG: N-acyl homoserine lactonase family protein [Candidatus Bathyarchaeota archaeon]